MPCGRPLSRSWNRPPSLRHHERDIGGAYGWKPAQRPDLSIVLRPYLFPDLTIVVDHGRKELAFGRVAAEIDRGDEDAVLRHVPGALADMSTSPPLDDWVHGGPVAEGLFTEGLAVLASARVVPSATDAGYLNNQGPDGRAWLA